MAYIYFIRAPIDDELYHFGIKGMKWGFRKDDYNNRYSKDERKVDKALYGRRGVKRINKRMNQGVSLNDARAIESRRLVRARKKAKYAAGVGAGVGALTGYVVGSHYAEKINNNIRRDFGVNKWVNKGDPGLKGSFASQIPYVLKRTGKDMIYEHTIGEIPRKIVAGGGAYIGGKIGSRLGRSAYMLYSGYSPRHFR